jgi:hypothetical protein
MNYNHPRKGGSAVTVRVACAIVFLAFTYLWLRYFQADVMAVAQHVLSGGKTHFNYTIGPLLITALLMLVQVFVDRLIRLRTTAHALTYVPSMLLLSLGSTVNVDAGRVYSWQGWWWGVPLVLVVWAVCVWAFRQIQPLKSQQSVGLFSRPMWHNLLLMALMMLMVAAVSNTDAVFHYRAHAEASLLRGDFDEALRTGERSHESDPSLTMLRVYALSRRGQLGEHLFNYPVSGTSDDLLPGSGQGQLLLYPADSIYRHLGARPVGTMSAIRFMDVLEQSGKATRAVADYRLCALLVDRRLDDFVSQLLRYYPLNDSLPRHYREALVLYAHQRSQPVVVYRDNVIETDYDDMQQLERTYADATERKGKVMEKYAGCYWYYYKYRQ